MTPRTADIPRSLSTVVASAAARKPMTGIIATAKTTFTTIDQTAKRRLGQLMDELVRSSGADETMKATDPMRWTGLMNTLKSQAEEMILSELIYS